MEPFKAKRTKRDGPESVIQKQIIAFLEAKGWGIWVTHGNEFQHGFPDLFCANYTLGTRWIEVKNPSGFRYTSAQMKVFPEFASKGVGIWVLTAASEYEYAKLSQPANWWAFIGKSKVD